MFLSLKHSQMLNSTRFSSSIRILYGVRKADSVLFATPWTTLFEPSLVFWCLYCLPSWSWLCVHSNCWIICKSAVFISKEATESAWCYSPVCWGRVKARSGPVSHFAINQTQATSYMKAHVCVALVWKGGRKFNNNVLNICLATPPTHTHAHAHMHARTHIPEKVVSFIFPSMVCWLVGLWFAGCEHGRIVPSFPISFPSIMITNPHS